MNPKEYRYTKEHDWICLEPNNEGKIGITDYAQSHLGDIVFIDLPAPGTKVEQFGKLGEIESVKSISEIITPVSGEVLETNQTAVNQPQLVNQDPYGEGWLVRLKLTKPSEFNTLMTSDAYDAFLGTE